MVIADRVVVVNSGSMLQQIYGEVRREPPAVPCDDCSSFDFSCTGKCTIPAQLLPISERVKTEKVEFDLEVSPKCRRSIMYRNNEVVSYRQNIQLIPVEAPELIFVSVRPLSVGVFNFPYVYVMTEVNDVLYFLSEAPNVNVIGPGQVCFGSAGSTLGDRIIEQEPYDLPGLFWNSIFNGEIRTNDYTRQNPFIWKPGCPIENFKNVSIQVDWLREFMKVWQTRRIPVFRKVMEVPSLPSVILKEVSPMQAQPAADFAELTADLRVEMDALERIRTAG